MAVECRGASGPGTQGVSRAMAEGGVRPRWHDALALGVLAVLLVAGLVYYGRGMSDEQADTADDNPPASQAPRAQAQLVESEPTPGPVAPAPPVGTCWDGRPTTALSLCGLPDGARGLAWVFPSFDEDRPSCHKARPNPDSYPVVQSFVCFQRALGRPVTITYDQIEDVDQVGRWLLHRVGKEHRRMVPGAHGGRAIFRDGRVRPARITGMYEKFPYVVSVYAKSPQAAAQAWRAIVRQRPPQFVRGVKA